MLSGDRHQSIPSANDNRRHNTGLEREIGSCRQHFLTKRGTWNEIDWTTVVCSTYILIQGKQTVLFHEPPKIPCSNSHSRLPTNPAPRKPIFLTLLTIGDDINQTEHNKDHHHQSQLHPKEVPTLKHKKEVD